MAPIKNVKKLRNKPKKGRKKIELVFDEKKRREFLTGFHKRKLQRKKQAKEQLEQDLKNERKRLKIEAKESYKKLIVSHRTIPELEHLNQEEYEEDDVTVKVVELSTNDIAKQNNWIGANHPIINQQSDNEDKAEESSSNEDNEIPGMELNSNKQKDNIADDSKAINIGNEPKFNNERDVKKALKKEATKNMKKSKVFQKKNKLERQQQRKKSFQHKKQKRKFREKKLKKKH